MKKYLLGAFLVIAMNSFGAKLSDVKGLEKLKNYNEIKDIQVEKIVNYDVTKSISKKIFSTETSSAFAILKSKCDDTFLISVFSNSLRYCLLQPTFSANSV